MLIFVQGDWENLIDIFVITWEINLPIFFQKPPPRPQAELQDVEAEEYDEEGVGYEMPNVEAEDGEESPVSQMSPPALARAKHLPPQQPLSSGKL